MAENTGDQGIDTTDLDINRSPRLPLGELSRNELFLAIVNENRIVELAQLLKSIGDLGVEVKQVKLRQAEDRRKLERRISVKENFSRSFKKVLETLDIVLEWLEQSTKKSIDEAGTADTTQPLPPVVVDQTDTGATAVDGDQQEQNPDEFQKKESVLRGLYHIIGFGDYFVMLLERSCKFLDLPENPYKAKREHIKKCLDAVEEKRQKISGLVEKACDLLQEITNEPQFNRGKAAQFNTTVRQADVMIASCKTMLSDAQETIDELMKIMSTMKSFSRVLRFAGFGTTCYTIYQLSPSTSTVDSIAPYVPPTGLTLLKKFVLNRGLKYVGFGALCAVAAYSWLSLFPSRAYGFRDDLEELNLKHKRFTNSLCELEENLRISIEGFTNELRSRGDSV